METATPQRHASGGPGKEPQHRNLFEAFVATVDRLGDDVAIRTENQALLASPLSTEPADLKRRADFRAQVIAYNGALAEVCALYKRCLFDGKIPWSG
jgi:hypothetical protein